MTQRKAKLFTFVLDYRGGTYISQIESDSVSLSLRKWLDVVDLDEVWGLTNRGRSRFREALLSHDLAAVDRVSNVWCASGRVRGALATVHVVQTSGGARRVSHRGHAR